MDYEREKQFVAAGTNQGVGSDSFSGAWERSFAAGARKREPGRARGDESGTTKLVGGADAGCHAAAFRKEFAGDACEMQSSRRGGQPDGGERRRQLPFRVGEIGAGVSQGHSGLSTLY